MADQAFARMGEREEALVYTADQAFARMGEREEALIYSPESLGRGSTRASGAFSSPEAPRIYADSLSVLSTSPASGPTSDAEHAIYQGTGCSATSGAATAAFFAKVGIAFPGSCTTRTGPASA